jgi:hypothetical protein
VRALLSRLLRRRRAGPASTPEVRTPPLGAPPAGGDGADEAELDTLRGELVRELDRMAAEAGGSPPPTASS